MILGLNEVNNNLIKYFNLLLISWHVTILFIDQIIAELNTKKNMKNKLCDVMWSERILINKKLTFTKNSGANTVVHQILSVQNTFNMQKF